MTMTLTLTLKTFPIALAAAAALLAPLAHAVDIQDTPRAAAPAADALAPARKLIEARQWGAALEALQRVDDRGNADWNNLMGYVSRKGPTPDLGASERYYDAALRIDPHHRNTLEYSGELYLMKGDLPRAQDRLSSLSNECGSGCPQYAELKAAIARYESNGGRYVAAGNGW
jgi:tetratricopeptide (TPR) repeat protein